MLYKCMKIVLPAFYSVVDLFWLDLVRKLCLLVLVDSFKWGRWIDKQLAMCTGAMDRDPHPHGAIIIYIKIYLTFVYYCITETHNTECSVHC